MGDWRDELMEITECEFCDDDGVRLNGLGRCDHVDHGAASKRGMDMIRRAMGWTQ